MANGMYGAKSNTVNKQIIALANAGLPIKQIADRVGINPPAVASRMTYLMRDGKLKSHSERTGRINTQGGRYRILRKRYNRNTGSIMEILTNITLMKRSGFTKRRPKA